MITYISGYNSKWGDSEKSFLAAFFGQVPGFFIDIGAFDGVTDSNTRSLWMAGWTGILIEAHPELYRRLQQSYPNSERVQLINAAVCLTNGPVDFYHCKDPDKFGWHSMDQAWVSTWQPGLAERVTVAGVRFDSLPLPAVIDFLSIDTEGLDYAIIQSIPDSCRPRLIMAEVDKQFSRERIDREMERRGYEFVWGTYLNSAYRPKSP